VTAIPRTRIAVIGTGWWATSHHIPSLLANADAELVALADIDAQRLEAAGNHFGIAMRARDPAEVLSTELVDGVIIATPHVTHYPLARAAIDAGLHTFVEKPLALKAPDAWDLVARAQRRGVHLSVGYTAQYTPAAAAVQGWFRAGELGSPIGFACVAATTNAPLFAGRAQEAAGHYGFGVAAPKVDTYSSPTQAGGGQAQTQLTHTVGMLLFETGLAVTSVFARMHCAGLAVDVVDAMVVELSDGSLGTISATGAIAVGRQQTQELRYFGPAAVASHDILLGRAHLATGDGRQLEVGPTDPAQPLPSDEPARAFVELIAGRGANHAPAAAAAQAVSVVEAFYESAASGMAVAPMTPDCVHQPG